MDDEVGRLEALGATVLRRDAALTVMHLSRHHHDPAKQNGGNTCAPS
jgi:hypothetical protein